MVNLNVGVTHPLISKRRVVLVALTVVIMMNLRTFTYFPGIRPLEEAWFVLCILSFVLLYPILKIQNDWKFSDLELYLLAVLPFVIVVPAITAHSEFGQPLAYGLLARRSVALYTTWILLLNVWRKGWFRATDVERILIFLTWLTFGIFSVMRLTLNPLDYLSTPGFVVGPLSESPAFTEPGIFMSFGVLYYALQGMRKRRIKYYLYALILYLVAVGGSGRFLTVTFAVVLAYFLIRWRSLPQVGLALAQFLSFVAVALTIAYLISPTNVTNRVVKFGQAIQVATGASDVEDYSAAARVVETNLAKPYINKHPYLGVGVLSTQWSGTATAVGTSYFFTDDIGLVGIAFSYGLLGLAFLAFQYFFAVRAGASIPKQYANPLVDGTKAFVLFTAVFSITTGGFVFSFEQSSFFISLLVLLAKDFKAAPVVARQPSREFALAAG